MSNRLIDDCDKMSGKHEERAMIHGGSATSFALLAVVYELRALREQLRLALEADRVEIKLDEADVSL